MTEQPLTEPDGFAAWPSADHDLRGMDDDWWLVACFNLPLDQWIGYVSGYREAAEVLVAHIAGTGHSQDTLAYPFLLCWRHYTELQLKAINILLQRLMGCPVEVQRTHKIGVLWARTQQLLKQAGFGDLDPADAEAQATVERVLRQLDELDPSSEHFRYPVMNNGAGTLPGLDRLHLRRFHEAMTGAANFLDATDTMLREEIDTRREIAEAFTVDLSDGM